MMMNNVFSDTSATDGPSTPSDDIPLVIIEDTDPMETDAEHFTNNDPLDLNNFPPLPNAGVNDQQQSPWHGGFGYPNGNPTFVRSRHVSESSNNSSLSFPRQVSSSEGSSLSLSYSRQVSSSEGSSSSLPRSRPPSESSTSSLPRSRHVSEGSSSSLPRSRHVSEGSISPHSFGRRGPVFENSPSPFFLDEYTTCEIHSHANEFFCNDCGREICKDCATRNHHDHSFRLGYTYSQLFSRYRLSRNLLQEHKVRCEKVVKNLNSRFTTVATSIRACFQRIHETAYARERMLLEELKRVFEHRKLLVGSRSFEAEKALTLGDQFMDKLFDACKMSQQEKARMSARMALKHLDAMNELARKIDTPVDDVSFVTHRDDHAVIDELKTLGSIKLHRTDIINANNNNFNSYNRSWNNDRFSWDFGGPDYMSGSYANKISAAKSKVNSFNDYKGNYVGMTTSSNYNQPMNTPPQTTSYDAAPTPSNTYNPFTSFIPPELPVTGAGTSPVEHLALALATMRTASPVTASSKSPTGLPPSPSTLTPSPSDTVSSNLSMLPFCNSTVTSPGRNASKINFGRASANINIPRAALNTMSALGRPLSSLPWNRGANDFKVSVHRSRNYSRIRRPVVVFGQEGKGDTDLCRPWGVCCDDNGHVIVADRSNNRIQIFRSDGTHVRHFGVAGSEEGQFNRPAGVAIDLKGRIVVCDKDNHRVQVFTLEGELCLCFGRRGSTIGQFNYPWDVAVAPVSGIYAISDTRNHRIQMFTDQGTYIKHFGFETHSSNWKLFDSPRGVCFTPESTLMCTDFNSHRLFEIDYMVNGANMLRLEQYKKCQLYRPQKLTMDHDGNILVTDCRNNRVVVFARDGRPIATFGVAGKENGQFDRPSGMSITPDGKVVIVDFGNHRIQIF